MKKSWLLLLLIMVLSGTLVFGIGCGDDDDDDNGGDTDTDTDTDADAGDCPADVSESDMYTCLSTTDSVKGCTDYDKATWTCEDAVTYCGFVESGENATLDGFSATDCLAQDDVDLSGRCELTRTGETEANGFYYGISEGYCTEFISIAGAVEWVDEPVDGWDAY
jgi:hypothetical protein